MTLTSSWPIVGDSLPVTMTLTDVPGGNAVEITISIAPGAGDLLGFFANLTDESLVPQLDAVGTLVTQEQYAANQVYKVGGGNDMSPVRDWDLGLRFESVNWQSEDIHTVTFQLTAPGLTVAHLVNAANQGWYLGVRIQHTLGPKKQANIGFPVTPPPPGNPPTISIGAPSEGAILGQSDVTVSGPITGTLPLYVTANGLAAPLTAGSASFIRTLTLADGAYTIPAIVGNSYGYQRDDVTITVDTVAPVVSIASPATGTLTTADSIAVTGTATDATSGVASVVVNGVTATLTGSTFSALVTLASLGVHPITATATDHAGKTASASTSVTRGAAPTVAIAAPASGLLTNQTPIAVSGTVTGTAPSTVSVNGVSGAVTGSSWSANVPLVEGANTLTATVLNDFGSESGSVAVTLDTTPPVVSISAPANGATVTSQPVAVSGTVVDASEIASLRINGDPIAAGSSFSSTAALTTGPNTIAIEATDAAGNTGSASVSVAYESSAPLAISIETPPEGALLSDAEVEVAGTVSEAAEAVRVNGVLATVTGTRWVAARVPLVEGANTLTAVATRASATASAAVNVRYNAPPLVVITSPRAGELFRAGTTDVEGVVDDAGAFVDVNGVTAAVGSGGRFTATDVPLAPGDNTLLARAIDALGAQGTDEIAVLRDDAAAGRSKLVVVDFGNLWVSRLDVNRTASFSTLVDWDENLAIGNTTSTWSRPFPVARSRFAPSLDTALIFAQPQLLLLLEQAGDTSFEAFREGEATPFRGGFTQPALPIADLVGYVTAADLVLPEVLEPEDFTPLYFASEYDLLEPCLIDAGCSPTAIQGGRVRMRATQAGVQREISLATDVRRPVGLAVSPSDGSVLAGNVVTLTGTVRDAAPFLDSVSYRVADDLGVVVHEGLAPLLVEESEGGDEPFLGRFTIPDLVLGDGLHGVDVTVWDGLGNRRTTGTSFTVDADAPAVSLISPLDGSAFVESEVQASLSFGAPTTLISVNGAPDGRSFAPGIALNTLTLPLALGPNLFQLGVENAAGTFTLSFTLHRVAEAGEVRIVAPTAGALVNSRTLTVTGTAPLGTPVVVVNGVLATIAEDRVAFSAAIPIPSTGQRIVAGDSVPRPYAITAEALPLGGRATVEITPDFLAPTLRTLLPADGSVRFDPSAAFSGFVSEEVRVTLESPTGAVTATTARDRAREDREPFNLFNARQFHRFELPPVTLATGPNALTLRLRDAAGNETVQPLTITRSDGALAIASPAAGSSIPALVADFTLVASEPVTIDAFMVAGRQVPSLTGASLIAGSQTFHGVPLAAGANGVRVVYRRSGGAQEVITHEVTSTATGFATVTGQVTDLRTGAPIAGALVSITAEGRTLTVVTDAQGFYRTDVGPGLLTVVTAAPGFATANTSGTATAGGTLTANLPLTSTGLLAVQNELRILVPPAGTVTDFEQLTIVGTVLHPTSAVSVNGIAAQVVGNRFTARHVPLAMGANTISVSASVLGLPNATTSVAVERSNTPVLAAMIFSPPDGARVPGGGLVVRGFVSARDAHALLADRFASIAEGIVTAEEVDLRAGANSIALVAQLGGSSTAVRDEIEVEAATSTRALRLDADPTTASVPFDATLRMSANVSGVLIARLDFDLDGDRVVDVGASAADSVEAHYAAARRYEARAYVALPGGAELSAATRIGAYLTPTVTRRFAMGNPVDVISRGSSLYVLDGAAGRISRYDRDGVLLDAFGASGAGSAQLGNPQAFAIAADGRFYVADTGNDRIQVFSPAGVWERTIGTPVTGSGQLDRPVGIAITADRLLVSDQGNQRIAAFDLDGNALGPFAGVDARGLFEGSGQGVLVASPQSGLLSLVDDTIQSIPRLEDRFAAGELGAPVDVSPGDAGVWLADASAPRLWSLTDSLGFRRVIDTPTRLPLAVARGLRREVESVYVADGTEVTEIALPTPSPLPVVNELKARLMANDVAGALAQIHPLQRARYGEIYAARGAGLAADAAAMQSFEIDLLRDDRAIVRVRHLVPVDGIPREYASPIHLNRTEDGSWLVYDY